MRMKLKPEERPQFVVLMTAITLITFYLIFFIVPRLSHATPAPTTPDAPAPAASASVASATPAARPAGAPQTVATVSDANRTALTLIDTTAPRDVSYDPFVPPVVTSTTAGSTVGTPTASQASAPQTTIPPKQTGAVTPPLPKPVSSSAPTALPDAQAMTGFTLLGIASAEEAVAVFQIGHETVEKRRGDSLPGNVRIEAIEEEAVRLSRGKRQFRMEVGQAPVPAEIPASEQKGQKARQ